MNIGWTLFILCDILILILRTVRYGIGSLWETLLYYLFFPAFGFIFSEQIFNFFSAKCETLRRAYYLWDDLIHFNDLFWYGMV